MVGTALFFANIFFLHNRFLELNDLTAVHPEYERAEYAEVSFVFAGCYQNTDLIRMPEINFCGNILSIYEKPDPYGVPAAKRKEASRLKVSRFKEQAANHCLRS